MTRTVTATLIIVSLTAALPARGETPGAAESCWSKLKASTQQLGDRLLDTPAGQVVRRTTKQVGRYQRGLTGRLTLGADRLEQALPSGASQAVRKTRDFNPIALSGYLTRKIKKDPAILGVGVASSVYTSLKEARMLQQGVSPLSVAAFEAATKVAGVGAVLLREHQKGNDRSFKETIHRVGREYRSYAGTSRAANRRYMRRVEALQRRRAKRSTK